MKRFCLLWLALVVLALAGCASAQGSYGVPALDDYEEHYSEYEYDDVSDEYVLKEDAVAYVWENCRAEILDEVADCYHAEDLFEGECEGIVIKAYFAGYDDAAEGYAPSYSRPGEEPETSDTEDAGEPPAEEWPDHDAVYTAKYIVNPNSRVFHRPECEHVSQLSDENKVERETTREQLVAEEFRPCQDCEP